MGCYHISKNWGRRHLEELALLLISVLIIIFREYSFFTKPRFWAEEGMVYFSYASSHSFLTSLLKTYAGYYSLFNNLAAVLASRLVPLEKAPIVTTILAFLVQCIPLLIVIWGNSTLWNTSFKKAIMIAIILFTPLSGEIWLNTINSRSFFCLSTVLILCEHVDVNQFKKNFYRALLIISPLSGVDSCFLAPLYLIKAWITKQREAVVQAGIISICALLQFIVVILWIQSGTMPKSRYFFPDIPMLGIIISIKNFAMLFCGLPATRVVSKYLLGAYKTGGSVFFILGYSCLLLDILFLSCLAMRLDNKEQIFILGGFLLLTLSSTYLAIDNKEDLINSWAGQRYYYVPNVLILSMLFHAVIHESKRKTSRIFSLFLSFLLIVGLLNGIAVFKSSIISDESWPVWSKEVAQWKKDPSYSIKIWPPGWKMNLGRPANQ